MNVLKTTTDAQNLLIIPRKYIQNVVVTIKDDQTREETVYNSVTTIENGSMVISESFALKEGRFYSIRVVGDNEVLYTGRILCTDETNLDHYTMGNNYTSSNESSNIIFI